MQDGLVIQREGQKVMCLHSAVSINGKERTLRCRKCETLIDPFDYLMTLCDQESRYWETLSIFAARKAAPPEHRKAHSD
jgi:hypothetical protein